MIENNFLNAEVETNQLPQIQSLEQTNLSEKYPFINLIISICFTGLLLLIGTGVLFQPFIELPQELTKVLSYILVVVLLLGSLITCLNYMSDKRKSYAIRNLDIHYSSGLFFRKTISQPITRIQHIELKRGPIDRKTELAKLQVFSAGGSMHTFEIPGLPVDIAQKLRQFIIEHKDVTKHE